VTNNYRKKNPNFAMFDKEKNLIKTALLWITNQTLMSFCGIAKNGKIVV
jgi:hypothetical protein